jgi:hypothetical protein
MFFALVTVVFVLFMQPQPPVTPPGAADARIAGRVVDAESSAAVAGAEVMLLPVRQPFPPAAMAAPVGFTDRNGEFVLARIWAGRYRVQIRKTGFAPLNEFPDRETLDIGAGQSISGLTFALKKGGVIAGRVLEAGGGPAAEITVHAIRQAGSDAGGSSGAGRTMGMAQTNDLGEFRLAALPEGRYVVIAAPRPPPPFAQGSPANGTVQAPTYYPGTTSSQAAHGIEVASGQTIDGIQFSIVTVHAHQVSGVVVDETGSPQPRTTVTLMGDPRPDGLLMPAAGSTDETGAFSIGGVLSGTYRVTAMIPAAFPVGAGVGANAGISRGVWGGGLTGGPGVAVGGFQVQGLPSTEVTVDNADVSGVRIVVPTRRP